MPIDRTTLPPNVRRWLDKAIPVELPAPNRILNTQKGEMDIRGKWMSFTAETLYQPQPFTFIWKARFTLFPGVWLTAEDGHDSEKGWGGARLWGIVPMGGRSTPEVFAMQVVRSLAELSWNPQFALTVLNLEWNDTSDTTFQVQAVFGGQQVSVGFELNGDDEIIRACGKRHYDVPDGFVEAKWQYEFSDHRDFGAVRIPSSAVASYDKPEGVWEYWRGRITSFLSTYD
jgi:hypothetical protein